MNKKHLKRFPADWADAATLYTAIGDQHRQRVLMMFEPGEVLALSRIIAAMPLSRSASMHHLKILREAGALLAWREGKELYFSLNKPRFTEILGNTLAYLDAHPDEVGAQ